MWNEVYGDLRGMITEGIVLKVNDTGTVQTIEVQTQDGVVHTDVEVHQAAGLASSPMPGGKCVVFAVGGDVANLRALPPSDTTRFGNQANGERTLYAPDGTRVSVRNGGIIEIWAGHQVIVHVPNVTIVAPMGVSITGDVTVTGNIRATGDITDRDGLGGALNDLRQAYDVHRHGNVVNGGGSTAVTDHPV